MIEAVFFLTILLGLGLSVFVIIGRRKKRIYLAHPVRFADTEYAEKAASVVYALEAAGHEVYYPARDTEQALNSYGICQANCKGVRWADEVHVIWDGKSQGVLFDMGMAFAMKKPIRVVSIPEATEEKSFQNLMYMWERFNNG